MLCEKGWDMDKKSLFFGIAITLVLLCGSAFYLYYNFSELVGMSLLGFSYAIAFAERVYAYIRYEGDIKNYKPNKKVLWVRIALIIMAGIILVVQLSAVIIK